MNPITMHNLIVSDVVDSIAKDKMKDIDETPPRLVYIEWIDSAAMHGWHSLKDIREDSTLAVIQSIGWLIIDTEEQKTLVAHMHMELPQNGVTRFGSDPLTIPTVVIRKMVDIGIPE